MFIQFFQYEFLEELAIPNKAWLYWSIVLGLLACQAPAFFCPMAPNFSKESARFVSTAIQTARQLANPETPKRSNDGATIDPCLFCDPSHVRRQLALYYAVEAGDLNSRLHQHK